VIGPVGAWFRPDGPSFSPQALLLGNVYVLIGKFDQAVALFKEALTFSPQSALVHNNLAVAYYYNKQYDLALRCCDKASALGYKVEPRFLDWLRYYRKKP